MPVAPMIMPPTWPVFAKVFVAGLAIFVVVWLGMRLIGMILKHLLARGPFRILDRLLGAILAIVKVIAVILILIIIIQATPWGENLEDWVYGSPFITMFIEKANPYIEDYSKKLNKSFDKNVKKKIKDVKKKGAEAISNDIYIQDRELSPVV